jgi:hypothetical protein
MPFFHKYNLTNGYETFIYYDDFCLDGRTYYVQYMYAGFIDGGEPDVTNETCHSNLIDSSQAYDTLYDKLEAYIENANCAIIDGFSPPRHITASLLSHFQKYNLQTMEMTNLGNVKPKRIKQ